MVFKSKKFCIVLSSPSGAGKTTLTNILDGAITPNSGTVYLNGKRIDQLPPFEVARAGLGRTFQVTRSFHRMTVLENLLVPALAKDLTVSKDQVLPKAMEVLEFLTIDHLRNEYAQALSGGQQKLLELGRLLMLDPDIIILDEPFAGVHPKLMEIIYGYIRRVNYAGKAIILISHQMESIFTLCGRLLVLNFGEGGSDWHTGRVDMQYHDLIPDRHGGRFIVSHIRIPEGGPVPDYVHHHKIHFQMIFCYKGWVKVVYEDQGLSLIHI